MNPISTRRAILIVGMHRSGTSAVAGAMAQCGVEFGTNLLGARPENPRGFYEDAAIVALHDRLLAQLGRSWQDPRPVDVGELTSDQRERAVAAITDVLTGLFGIGDLVAVKDPRACRFLPLWHDAFVAMEVEPTLLFVHRPTAEVADSLRRRSGMGAVLSTMLDIEHVTQAERDSRQWRRAHIDYPRFSVAPAASLEPALAALDLDIDLTKAALRAVDGFVSATLRHSDDNATLELPAGLEALRTAVDSWRSDLGVGGALAPADALDALSEDLAAHRAALDPAFGVAADYAAQLRLETERHLEDAVKIREERDGWLQALNGQVDELRGDVAKLLDQVRATEAERDAARKVVEERDAQLHGTLEPVPGMIRDIRHAVAKTQSESAFFHARIQELDDWLNQVVNDQREHAGHILRVQREVMEIGQRRSVADRVVGKAQRAPAGIKRRLKARQLGPVATGTPSQVATGVSHARASGPAPITAVVRDPRPEPSSGTLDERIANLAFVTEADPVVSIVIPVFNEVETTVQCLESLRDCPPQASCEVIIVNDCSDDPDFDKLRTIDGLVIVDNPVNSGFVYGCNNGAANATGQFVFFLNNDTQITAGAIDWLVQTFELFPDAGAAGSKLVFPDGTVQDAGGLVWKDATAWNYGRGAHPDEPHLNYARAVDYCAGAALMVPKALFDELGGFDDHFAPAYYEDTDLCMRIKQSGREVVFQPASVVYHHEGKSYGTDVRKETGKHHQVINESKFYERWRDVLADHNPNGVDPEREKERSITKRALVIDARVLTPDQDSGSLRMTNMLRLLRRLGYKVTFVPDNLLSMEPYTRHMQAMGVEVITSPFVDDILEFLRTRGEEFDVAILSRLEVIEKHLDAARLYCSNATVLYDTVDLHFLRQQREQALTGTIVGGFDAERTRVAELDGMARADATLVCSPVEQELLAQELPDAKIFVVGNVHDEATSPTPPAERDGILFVGGFEHPPNVDGITWFVHDILPLVVQENPEAMVHVVGSKMPSEIADLAGPNVTVHGFVENLDDLYDAVRVCIAPLRYGAGVKGKLTQPMARGIPCVGTVMAAEGIPVEHGTSIMLADDPGDFAHAIAQVLRDDELWQRLADGGQDVVARTFSLEAIEERLHEAILVKEAVDR